MKMWYKSVSLCVLICVLTGCWDQILLKDVRLILNTGLDEGTQANLRTTFVVVDKKSKPRLVAAEGNTPRDTRVNLAKELTREPDTSKNRLVAIGDKMAKNKLGDILDVFYRDPKSALSAKIVVIDGKANDFLANEHKHKPNLIVNLDRQVIGAEKATIVPNINLQSVLKFIHDPGQDIVLPYMGPGHSGSRVKGVALFSNQVLSGFLSDSESPIYLLLAGQMGETATFSVKTEKNTDKVGSLLTLRVYKAHSQIKLAIVDQQVQVNIQLTMKAQVEEYPKEHQFDESNVKKLNEFISSELTEDARQVIQKLQKFNCDALGIGRRLIAFHHDYWATSNWDEVYPGIKIEPHVTVKLTRPGIIN
ncbi:Ger(x)C family spore germination protein [Paenibacillus sp. HWE-109]|uniref:Ger(x)C family spore germination protein n=1 Tax=Paenibacillus sp. HWE-109 TaxID=1306526 RepID=UPI001EE0D74C|nr:Ger(x)C family spore germination protein [Paenibacillus sp. HWE-109]UKS28749.1 Ger(x)C family spore germination protein [Paenibacillus sp. HWE-109]